MVIRRRAELDVVSPPGMIRGETIPPGMIRPAHMEKSLQGHIEDYLSSSEHNEEANDNLVRMAEYFKGGQSE